MEHAIAPDDKTRDDCIWNLLTNEKSSWGLTQAKAAELCAVSERTFRRWISGKISVPQGAWELLQIKTKKPDQKYMRLSHE